MDSTFKRQRNYYHFDQFFKNNKEARKKELSNIKVAVLDTGVDYVHPHLKEKIAGGKSFVPNEHWWADENGHGTHCAGIIAGDHNGLAPDLKLYVGKVLDSNGFGSMDWLSEGIQWAMENDVDIISMSLGSEKYHRAIWEKIQAAISKGIIVVCAAGNNGSMYDFAINFPATIGGVIRVGSVNNYGRASDFSSVGGPQIDVAALGEKVLSTSPCYDGKVNYCYKDGTSMATPFIAAICALLLAYDRGEGFKKIENAHCMKVLLGGLCINTTQEVAKGRGTVRLKRIFEDPKFFKCELDDIC